MAKKYLLRSFKPGSKDHNKINTLLTLNSLGLNTQSGILKNSLAIGASEFSVNGSLYGNGMYPYSDDDAMMQFAKVQDLTKNTAESYAYMNMSYQDRVEYLREFSTQHQTIALVLDTITDDAIVPDENGYFAHLDLDQLRANISAGHEDGEKLIETCEKAFKRVYSMYGWDRNNGAWNYFKKFLIEGHLAFEIIFDNLDNPKEIVGFKYINPGTLEPGVEYDNKGNIVKVWYQNRNTADERVIPDINIIYISWQANNNEQENAARMSYLEGLVKSYNVLAQMENSRLVWNVQNAQKRIKIIVPVGDLSPARADNVISSLKAEWNEETSVDVVSGEVIVNGNPQFSFTKTYFFPQRSSGTITLEEMAPEGYDLSTIEPVKWFWKRFIAETKLPTNRFNLDLSGEGVSLNKDDSAITREEYAYGRFINRIQNIFREILLKPIWIQVCLYMPKLAPSNFIKQAIGIVFNEENIFAESKERASLQAGASIVSTLSGMVDSNGQPIFSIQFLVEKFLNMTQEDKDLNEKYKQQEQLDKLEAARLKKEHDEYNAQHPQAGAPGQPGGGEDFGGGDFGGGDFGGGGFGDDFGGGADFGGGGVDFGGEGGGAPEPAPEPAAAEPAV